MSVTRGGQAAAGLIVFGAITDFAHLIDTIHLYLMEVIAGNQVVHVIGVAGGSLIAGHLRGRAKAVLILGCF